jgi:drug/metabolite transporter (DMT)-like permease
MAVPDMPQRRTIKRLFPVLLLLAGGSVLGFSTNLAKLAGNWGLTPLAFLAWSITGAAAILLVIAVLRGSMPPVDRRSLQYYGISALVGVAGSNFIFLAAIPHVGASFVAMIITLPPLLTYIGALVLRLERLQATRAMGVAAALAGAGVLATSQLAGPDAETFWILLALCGPVLLAIGNLYRTLRWPVGASPQALAPGMLLAAAAMLLLAGLLPGYSLAIPLDRNLPVLLIVVQALVFALQFQILFLLQQSGGPVLLSLLGSVGAVVAIPVAIFLQNEAPPVGLIPSAALIAIGIFLVALGQAKSGASPSAGGRPKAH